MSGPSGVGKGTVVRRMLERRSDLVLSISYTTRAPRPGEQDGRHYRFVSRDEFERMIGEDAFLEWAEVFGERYGTPAAEVEATRRTGRDVILEIDVLGAASVRRAVPDSLLVFLEPPSEEELARRLRERGTESTEELERRLVEARRELSEARRFDHVVVNDEINRAAQEVLAIIDAARAARGAGNPRGAG
ncbi:MAG: guanylate kinase [Actinomycetota bacterium]